MGLRTRITLKIGKGFHAPWLVAEGTVEERRQQLIQLLGLDSETADELIVGAIAVLPRSEPE